MNIFRTANVTVRLTLASGKEVSAGFTMAAEQAKYLEPLSRLHDAPMEWKSARAATFHIRERHELVKRLSAALAEHICGALHEQDPYNGYDRSELR